MVRAMSRPVIGVTLDAEAPGGYSKFPWYAARENYFSAVVRAGGLPIALPHEPELVDEYLAHLDGLMITGGDSIMESLGQDEARTKLQWDIWRRVLKGECSLPVECVIGNHDVWGWNKMSSGTTGKEPRYGKVWAQEALELDQLLAAAFEFARRDGLAEHVERSPWTMAV